MRTVYFAEARNPDNHTFRTEDIVVVDNMMVIPNLADRDVMVEGLLVVMINSGHVSFNINGRRLELYEGNVFVCNPRNIMESLTVSADLRITGLFCTAQYVSRLIQEIDSEISQYVLMHRYSVAELTEYQAKMFLSYIATVKTLLTQEGSVHKQRAISLLLQSMGESMKDAKYISHHEEGKRHHVKHSSAMQIMQVFLEQLKLDGEKVDNVNGYAHRLNITPKYFSCVCKQVSGKTAGEIIRDHVLREAKILLHQPSLSIKQIAARMGFKNASHFGTWIRRTTGLSPQALRNTR